MNTLQIELPEELRAEVVRRAGAESGGVAAWVAEAVRARLAALAEVDYLEARAARGSREAYRTALGKVPAAEPVPGDER
ncbi:MAG: hypothetical protein K2P78_01780 [Gemmataceae bacterium]|nr:hypothetical protein [Gemmataceae bacterium]